MWHFEHTTTHLFINIIIISDHFYSDECWSSTKGWHFETSFFSSPVNDIMTYMMNMILCGESIAMLCIQRRIFSATSTNLSRSFMKYWNDAIYEMKLSARQHSLKHTYTRANKINSARRRTASRPNFNFYSPLI